MLISHYETEDFEFLYAPEEEQPPPSPQGCAAGARMQGKLKFNPEPEFQASPGEMGDRGRGLPEGRAADLYPRLRTHFDEPDLEQPFAPICGEFIQWVGRTADGGCLAMSNYRVHVAARRRGGGGLSLPLRLLDALEVRDLTTLLLLCKDGKTVRCTFPSSDACLEWQRRLGGCLAPPASLQDTFAAAYAVWAREYPPASVHRALLRASHAVPDWWPAELERLGFLSSGAWRVSVANREYQLCGTYPRLLLVPAVITDAELAEVARFRAMRRIPVAVWRHRGSGAVLARAAQPEVGWLGWRNPEDERLLAHMLLATHAAHGKGQNKLIILDARSYTSAVTNRARGGGCECPQYYPHADIQFMGLPNIHHMRRSLQQLRQIVAESEDQNNWLGSLERSMWLWHVGAAGRAAAVCARAVLGGRSVLVHCSDGWDRTPQLVAAAQLMLDPYYRTVEGFRVLIQREWLDFGHKFASRCGHAFGRDEPSERSPIFLQWLDLVHQMALQYPCSFEFTEAYLVKLVTHVHSCMFGTFLCNSNQEREECGAGACAGVWAVLAAAPRNRLYCEPPRAPQVLWPDFSVRALRPWWSVLRPQRRELHDDAEPAANGVLTKTRSCEQLADGAEPRAPQRRSSDPSVAADIMKLSRSMASAALTDSCVDGLRSNGDQTDAASSCSGGGGWARLAGDSVGDSAGDSAGDGVSPDREPPDYRHVVEHARAQRSRTISIGWRSDSESSQAPDPPPPYSENGSETDEVDAMTATLTNHNRIQNGDMGAAWSSGSSSTSGSSVGAAPAEPAPPGRPAELSAELSAGLSGEHPPTPADHLEPADSTQEWWWAAAGGGRAADGLPHAVDAVQERVAQMQRQHQSEVSSLRAELEACRALLRRAAPAPPAPAPEPARPAPPPPAPAPPPPAVELGEEPCAWLPDTAAPSCLRCNQAFWLARRRHHCRRCGGIFCGSCSEMCGGLRLCRRCQR